MSSEQFALDDIHRIRYDNFENSKQMSSEELIENTKRQAETGKKCWMQSGIKRKQEPVTKA
jgi:hypothetical protein